jgi:hypothetical protein
MQGRSAASVLCSVQTRTLCYSDVSKLHWAVIVKELHKEAQTSNTTAVFITFQPQVFIITIITRLQTNNSSDCELVQEELLTHASCVTQFPQGIQLCIVCEHTSEEHITALFELNVFLTVHHELTIH